MLRWFASSCWLPRARRRAGHRCDAAAASRCRSRTRDPQVAARPPFRRHGPDSRFLPAGQRHLALDETLWLIPGLTVSNRNNPSQDPRISIRGFGARSAFGVRGIRVLRDGIPLTLPDGQTPVDYLDLESVGRVEVMRGSASSLYGNAGGGVIDLRTTDPLQVPVSGAVRLSSGAIRVAKIRRQDQRCRGERWVSGQRRADRERRLSRLLAAADDERLRAPLARPRRRLLRSRVDGSEHSARAESRSPDARAVRAESAACRPALDP